ncbi:MAG: hypothetical protein M0Z87_05815 [Actinomycetota bacterium]|nr:hypothetical protein [Actinomycetota bacterium]
MKPGCTIHRGTVVAFDLARGLGEIEAGAGSPAWIVPFHCTAISDGSRDIGVGAPVVFRLSPGGLGVWEAGEVVKLGGSGPEPMER